MRAGQVPPGPFEEENAEAAQPPAAGTTTRRRSKRGRRPREQRLDSPNLYAPGTPVDDNGFAEEGAEIDVEDIGRIPVDADSARVSEMNRRTMARKASGEGKVPWNADMPVRYWQLAKYVPHAFISIRQIRPSIDDSIPGSTLRALPTYDDLKRYIKETHWKGGDAMYEWRVYDSVQPQHGLGTLQFVADPNWLDRHDQQQQESRQPQQQPQYQQFQNPYYPWTPPGYQPPGGFAPPGAMGPMGYPQMGQPPQQTPQAQQAQPQPGADALTQVLSLNATLVQQNAAYAARCAQLEQYIKMLEQQIATPKEVAPAPQPPPQPSAIATMRESLQTFRAIRGVTQELAQEFTPQEAAPAAAASMNIPDSDFKVRDLGPMRIVEKDGEIVRDPITTLMFNGDKIQSAIKSAAKDFGEMIDRKRGVQQQPPDAADPNAARRRAAIEDAERLAAAHERIRAANQLPAQPAPPPRPPPQPAPSEQWSPPLHDALEIKPFSFAKDDDQPS